MREVNRDPFETSPGGNLKLILITWEVYWMWSNFFFYTGWTLSCNWRAGECEFSSMWSLEKWIPSLRCQMRLTSWNHIWAAWNTTRQPPWNTLISATETNYRSLAFYCAHNSPSGSHGCEMATPREYLGLVLRCSFSAPYNKKVEREVKPPKRTKAI